MIKIDKEQLILDGESTEEYVEDLVRTNIF